MTYTSQGPNIHRMSSHIRHHRIPYGHHTLPCIHCCIPMFHLHKLACTLAYTCSQALRFLRLRTLQDHIQCDRHIRPYTGCCSPIPHRHRPDPIRACTYTALDRQYTRSCTEQGSIPRLIHQFLQAWYNFRTRVPNNLRLGTSDFPSQHRRYMELLVEAPNTHTRVNLGILLRLPL